MEDSGLKVLAKKRKIKFIYSASSSAYGDQDTYPLQEDMKPNPMSPYAIQKLVGEYYGKSFHDLFGLPFIALRYFNVYGSGQDPESPYSGVVTVFKEQIKAGKPITVCGDGQQSRDFTHVADVVEANVAALNSDIKFGIYNVGTGTTTSIETIAKILGGTEYPIEYIPARQGDPKLTIADISKIKKDLGWSPKVGIKEGLLC